MFDKNVLYISSHLIIPQSWFIEEIPEVSPHFYLGIIRENVIAVLLNEVFIEYYLKKIIHLI